MCQVLFPAFHMFVCILSSIVHYYPHIAAGQLEHIDLWELCQAAGGLSPFRAAERDPAAAPSQIGVLCGGAESANLRGPRLAAPLCSTEVVLTEIWLHGLSAFGGTGGGKNKKYKKESKL